MFAFIQGIGTTELLIIFFVVLLLFGSKKLPELARGMGKAIQEFKSASSKVESELKAGLEDKGAQEAASTTAAQTAPAAKEAAPAQEKPKTPAA